MAKLDVFVAPQPWPAFARAMSWVNRVLMLHGLPLLRDIPLLRRIPGIRGLTNIRHISIDPNSVEQLRQLVAKGGPTFILPNHPEFFTDWMLDKEIISRCCPSAASWATNGVVNGLGDAAQKFWLWNNLIAQIPGDASSAKNHSIGWALTGHGVLLHPEGAVGWHSNWVAPLMSGAADMAIEAKKRAPQMQSSLVPVVWKLAFTEDATSGLAKEAAYIERKLKMPAGTGNPAIRAHAIYNGLADREMVTLGLSASPTMSLLEKRRTIETVAGLVLGQYLASPAPIGDSAEAIRLVRKKARAQSKPHNDITKAALDLADRLARTCRLGDFAFSNVSISQEEVAEHLKRLRNDWCKGSLKDTLNQYLPQPAARRTAHLRIMEAISLDETDNSKQVMQNVRVGLQTALDEINAELAVQSGRITYENPFFVK